MHKDFIHHLAHTLPPQNGLRRSYASRCLVTRLRNGNEHRVIPSEYNLSQTEWAQIRAAWGIACMVS